MNCNKHGHVRLHGDVRENATYIMVTLIERNRLQWLPVTWERARLLLFVLLISFMFVEVKIRAWWCTSRSGDDDLWMQAVTNIWEETVVSIFMMEDGGSGFLRVVVTISGTAWCLNTKILVVYSPNGIKWLVNL
jgi:hypothetical protein